MKRFIFILLLLLLVQFGMGAENRTETIDRVETVGIVERVYVVERTLDPKMVVFGTEYFSGERAKAFGQLVNGTNDPINNASCFVKVWDAISIQNGSPNIFKDTTLMMFLDEGIYFSDFDAPIESGVYPVSMACEIQVQANETAPSVFFARVGTVTSGNISSVASDDGIELIIDEQAPARSFDLFFNFTNISLTQNATSLSLRLIATRQSTASDPVLDNLNFHVFNYSTGEFVEFNEFAYFETEQTITLTARASLNFSTIVQNGTLQIRLNDSTFSPTDTSTTTFQIEELILLQTIPADKVFDVMRGGGEIHVTNTTILVQEIKKELDEPTSFNQTTILIIFLIFFGLSLLFIESNVWWAFSGIFYLITAFILRTSTTPELNPIVIVLVGIFGLSMLARSFFMME